MKKPLFSKSIKLVPYLITIGLVAIISMGGTVYYLSVTSSGRPRTLVVATTTSLYDTGLLEVIEKRFEEKYPIDLHFISVGTGLAIQHAMRGDADVILVHAPSKELIFMKKGCGVNRKIIAYNFFAIIGPASDPAKIKGLDIKAALKKIVEAGRSGKIFWISRGDESGTHTKEKELWKYAGFNWTQLRGEAWFLESGSGMGKTLLIANERDGYTLTDIGTYLKSLGEGLIRLEVLIGEDKELLNVYSVISVNPDKVPGVNFEDAITFTKFLISNECQGIIENYQKETYNQSLFHAAVNLLKEDTNPVIAQWIRDTAFFNGTECPQKYRLRHPELYGK